MHLKSKTHKKRVKSSQDIPYSHEEAMRAGGLQPEKVVFTDLVYAGKKVADYHAINNNINQDQQMEQI